MAIRACRRRRPVEIETACVKERGFRVSEHAAATRLKVFEDRASGIWAGREAKLDESTRRLIDSEHPRQPVAARLDRMVVSEHGRFELSFPCARVVAVRMSQSVIVEAGYGGITLASVGASEQFDLLVEIGYSLMRPRVASLLQLFQIPPGLCSEPQQPRAYAEPKPQTCRCKESADDHYGFHFDYLRQLVR